MRVITRTKELEDLHRELAAVEFVAVDTEFMRETTYWPKLCLIQAAGPGVEAVIDPLAEGLSLDPFLDLMSAKKVLKVFHAARQDLEIFLKLRGRCLRRCSIRKSRRWRAVTAIRSPMTRWCSRC